MPPAAKTTVTGDNRHDRESAKGRTVPVRIDDVFDVVIDEPVLVAIVAREDPVEHEAPPRQGIRRLGAIGTGRAVHRVAGAVFLLGYAWWAVSLPAFSTTATAAVLVAGGAAVVWGAARDRRRRPEIELRGAVPWALLAVVGGLWELAAYLQHPRDEHPTLSSLANALLDSHPVRSAALVLWLVATSELSRR